MFYNTTGSNNLAIGWQSLRDNVSGQYNTSVGNNALNGCKSNNNTAIGAFAGETTSTGYNNVCLGYNAITSSSSASNQVVLGNDSITSLRCAVTTITALSDKRDKKNIEKLELGLDFIKDLNPCGWNYDRRDWYPEGKSDGSKMSEERNYGFIAQELKEVQDKYGINFGLIMEDNPDKLETSEGRLLPLVIKAIQELASRLEKLEGENVA